MALFIHRCDVIDDGMAAAVGCRRSYSGRWLIVQRRAQAFLVIDVFQEGANA
jgi:hypothetical protein